MPKPVRSKRSKNKNSIADLLIRQNMTRAAMKGTRQLPAAQDRSNVDYMGPSDGLYPGDRLVPGTQDVMPRGNTFGLTIKKTKKKKPPLI